MTKHRPKHTKFEQDIAMSMSINALIQLILDIIFEALHLIPTRINHLSLTTLNAFIAWKSLSAMKRDRFSFLHEDCQILWLMEIFLIIGDVYYLVFDDFSFNFIYIRLIFILCSTYNFVCVTYIMCKYDLWSLSYKGSHSPPIDYAIEVVRRSIRRQNSNQFEVEETVTNIRATSGVLPVHDVHDDKKSNLDSDGDDDDELAVDERMDVTMEDAMAISDEDEESERENVRCVESIEEGTVFRDGGDNDGGGKIELAYNQRSSAALLGNR